MQPITRYASVALLLLLALVTACRPVTRSPTADSALVEEERRLQQSLAVRSWAENIRRLHRISYPLLVSAAPQCPGKLHGQPGFLSITDESFPDQLRSTVRETLMGGSSRITVINVLQEAPAAAGLRNGDVLTAMNGKAIGEGRKAKIKFEERLSELPPGERVLLEIERDGEPLELDYSPQTACSYKVLYLNENSEINAYADGQLVAVTRGMMRFTKDDRELALVVSHEIAHNLMDHVKKQQGNRLLGTLLDLTLAALTGFYGSLFNDLAHLSFSREFEQEADYVGLYLMARTGYALEGVTDFWRRMSVEHTSGIDISTTHPTSPQRFISINEVIKEIQQKQEEELPLQPEFK